MFVDFILYGFIILVSTIVIIIMMIIIIIIIIVDWLLFILEWQYYLNTLKRPALYSGFLKGIVL